MRPCKAHRLFDKSSLWVSFLDIAIEATILAALLLSLGQKSFALKDPLEVPREAGIDEHLNAQIDLDIPFVGQDGKQVSLRELMTNNRPVILTPVYYGCPRLCTLVLNGMQELVNNLNLRLGHDYSVVSVSFNYHENSELAQKKAASYYESLKVPKDGEQYWHFLTGSQANVNQLMQQIGFRYKEDGDQFLHAAVIIVLTPQGKISRYLYGVQYRPADAKLALIEASEGKVGSTLEKFLLFCFHFDPTLGKYTLAIMRVTQVVCFVLVAALILVLGSLRVKELRRKK